MDANGYQTLAMRTAKGAAIAPHRGLRMMYAILGLGGEAGELQEAWKKGAVRPAFNDDGTKTEAFIARGFNPSDDALASMDSEAGDVLWHLALYCEARGITLGALMATNIAKLAERHPELIEAAEGGGA